MRNLESHGDDSYEGDPQWWQTSVVGGDGINNATFRKSGITVYSHRSYSDTIEMVKTNDNKVFIKWNNCSAELIKK